MADFDAQVKWCDDVAELLKSHKQVAKLDVSNVVKEVQVLLNTIKDVHAKNKALAKSRVVTEYANYEQRFLALSGRAETIRTGQATKKIKEKVAVTQFAQVGQELLNVRNSINLALSEIDTSVAGKPEVKELRREAEKYRPVYENKRERIQEAIEELQELVPGPEAQISALIDLREAGLALEPDFQAAYKKLAGLTKLLKEGRKAAGQFDKGVGSKDYLKSIAAAQKSILAFEAVFAVGHADKVAEKRDALQKQREAIQAADKSEASIKKAIIEIDKIKLAADGLLTEYTNKKTTGDQQLVLRWAKIEKLELCAPVEVQAPRLQMYDAARSLLGSQQFDEFDKKLLELDKDFPLTKHEKFKQDWLNLLSGGVTEQLKTADRLRFAAEKDKNPKAAAAAATLFRAGDVAIQQLAPANNFEAALKLMKPLLDGLKSLADWDGKAEFDLALLKDESTQFLCALDELESQVVARWRKVTDRKGDLVNKGFDIATLPQPVMTQASGLGELEVAWRARIRGERTFAEAGTAETAVLHKQRLAATLATLKNGLKGELFDPIESLLGELLKLEPSPEAIKKNDQAKKLEAEKRKWASTQMRYLEQLQSLEDSVKPGSPVALEVAQLRAQLQDLPVKAGEAEAFEKMDEPQRKKLREKADLAIKDTIAPSILRLQGVAQQALTQQRAGKPALVKEAEALLKKLTEELKPPKVAKGQAKETWPAYAETLRLDLTASIAMVDTDNMAVVETGMSELNGLIVKVKDLLKAGPGGKSAIKGGFEGVLSARKALELKLTTAVPDEADKYLPNEIAQLLGEFRMSLPDQVKGVPPAEALKAIQALADKLEETRKKAVALAQVRVDLMKKEGKEVSDALTLLETTHQGAVKSLVAELRRSLAGVDKPAPQYTSGQLVLRDLLLTIKAANASPEARGELENKAAQSELTAGQDAELAPQRYESARDVFNKDLYRQVKALKKEAGSSANSALFQQIAQHLGAAKKSASAGAKFFKANDAQAGAAQYGAAQNSLRMAIDVAEAFIRNPLSATAASSKALIECDQRWKIAVGTYVEQVRGLKADLQKGISDYASKPPPQDPQVDVKRKKDWNEVTLKSMDKLLGLLDGSAFSATVKILSQPASKDAKLLALRRQNKETALALLSQFERELNANPLLSLTRSHPTSPVAVSTLTAALGGMRSAVVTS